MILSNIHSKYLIQELFSFITENKKLKLVKYNLFLINKLDLSIKDYKISFFKILCDNLAASAIIPRSLPVIILHQTEQPIQLHIHQAFLFSPFLREKV